MVAGYRVGIFAQHHNVSHVDRHFLPGRRPGPERQARGPAYCRRDARVIRRQKRRILRIDPCPGKRELQPNDLPRRDPHDKSAHRSGNALQYAIFVYANRQRFGIAAGGLRRPAVQPEHVAIVVHPAGRQQRGCPRGHRRARRARSVQLHGKRRLPASRARLARQRGETSLALPLFKIALALDIGIEHVESRIGCGQRFGRPDRGFLFRRDYPPPCQ